VFLCAYLRLTKKLFVLNKKVEEILNKQISGEASSSHLYLAMASWAENAGFGGTAAFLYTHSDEERQHMLKLVKFVNERGGKAIIPDLSVGSISFPVKMHELKQRASKVNGIKSFNSFTTSP